ncbi:MAG: efflux RND transporter permease subunit [Candidatus Goldbacteria bacterium]|nr:efflux RND transporter permease subunit [Candidatus Goldiibacteriota bacterium]
MKIVDFSVDRPVAISMLFAALLFGGIVAFFGLGLDLLPKLDFPMLTISTTYENAGPEDVEEIVTKTLESVASTATNLKHIYSSSQAGTSTIRLEFEWGTNLDAVTEDIRSKISRIKKFLPDTVDEPIIIKSDISMMPVLIYSISGISDQIYLKQYVEDNIVPAIERVEGVGTVFALGGLTREIQVRIDNKRLKSYNLSSDQITNILRYQNINVSGGYIVKGYTEYLVRVVGEYKNINEIRNTIIANYEGTPIYLKDVAEVVDTYKDKRHYTRVDGEPSVLLAVSKQSSSNTVQVIDRVQKAMKGMKNRLPENIKIKNVMNQGDTIKKTLYNTLMNGVVGAILAIVIVFLFLRNWRPTLVIALSIPISIIITFIGLYLMDYTFNVLTLVGFALVSGMLVDNAVVVIENTFRHLELGKGRKDAAKIGASEVGIAIAASTLTNICIFLPMVLAGGIASELAKPIAFTVTVGLLTSLFVAFTIVPMAAGILFKKEVTKSYEKEEKGLMDKFKQWYKKQLEWCLTHRKKVLIATGAMFVISLLLIPFLGFEFMPKMDSPMMIAQITLPVGTSLEETNRIAGKLEKMFLDVKEKEIVALTIGSAGGMAGSGMGASDVNEGMVIMRIVDKEKRKRSVDEITDSIRKNIPEMKGVTINFLDMSGMSGGGGMSGSSAPVVIKIFGDDLDKLSEIAKKVSTKIQNIKGIRDVDMTYKEGKPELVITPNKEKASLFGLTTGQISAAVIAAKAGVTATRYREAGKDIDIKVRFKDEDADTVHALENIMITTPYRTQVMLKQLVNISYKKGPVVISREDKKRIISVTTNIIGRDIGSIMNDVKAALKDVKLESGYFIEYGGSYTQMQESMISLLEAFFASLVLIYMIMAALYESFTTPFVILFTIPLGLIGVVLGLFVFGMTVSTLSFMGLIILAGVVVNNGIIMLDYVGQLRKRGMEKHQALIQGALTRVRPIFITSFTVVLGVIPMAFSHSQGSELRAPIGASVGIGLLFATFLTLIIIPVIYSVLDSISFKVKNKTKKVLHGEEQK